MFYLLDDSLFGPNGPHGGYIPFVELPCERLLGEMIKWISVLSVAPITCPLIPWLCCPLEFGNTSITISSDQQCGDRGAIYGSTIFWTMQAVSICGLILSFTSLTQCTAGLAGYDLPEAIPIVSSLDLTDNVADRIDLNEMIDIVSPLNLLKQAIVRLIGEGYKKQVAKGVAESEALQNSVRDTASEAKSRSKRQSGSISVPIPTLQGHVPGRDDPPADACERDEVLMDDGECQELLDQGPCEDDEYVLMDPITRKGFCAPRLCAPDRVFVFSDQQCHDPLEAGICPPGRRLFSTGFGTPVCGCPDGTYEEDDDLDDDVCEPVLGHISNCPPGEVFWFSSFRRPPECVPDPCKGLNLKRGPNDLPYAPALHDGKCYQIGSQPPFCQSDEFYSLNFELLRGVCMTLDDAGYQVLDSDVLDALSRLYSSPIPKEGASSSRPKGSPRKSVKTRRPTKVTPAGTTLLTRPEIGDSVMKTVNITFPPPFIMGQSVMASHDHEDNEVDSDSDQPMLTLLPTHMNAFSPPVLAVNGSFLGFLTNLVPGVHHRGRRSPQPFASPGNVFEPGLSACRAGARRDGNAKCRDTVLPSHYPPARPRRTVPPVPPRPACPSGSFWGLDRRCSANSGGIASAISSIGLG